MLGVLNVINSFELSGKYILVEIYFKLPLNILNGTFSWKHRSLEIVLKSLKWKKKQTYTPNYHLQIVETYFKTVLKGLVFRLYQNCRLTPSVILFKGLEPIREALDPLQ